MDAPERHKDILRKHKAYINKNLTIDVEMVDFLQGLSPPALTTLMAEEIKSELRRYSPRVNSVLVDHVMRRGLRTYKAFIYALHLFEQTHIAEMIDLETSNWCWQLYKNGDDLNEVLGKTVTAIPTLENAPRSGIRAPKYMNYDQQMPQAQQHRNTSQLETSLEQMSLQSEMLPTDFPNYQIDQASSISDFVRQPSVEEIKTKLDSDLCYDVRNMNPNQSNKGIVYIISNKEFVKAEWNRSGADRDYVCIYELFINMKFQVKIERDLTAQKMRDLIRDISTDSSLSIFRSLVVFVMTHGDAGLIYGTDHQTLRIEQELVQPICRAEHFAGKPKLFFIQACQGGGSPMAHTVRLQQDSNPPEKTDANPDILVPAGVDAFIAQSSIPDNVSFRHPDYGSWWVQAIVEVFKRRAHLEDINGLMTNVNALISRAKTSSISSPQFQASRFDNRLRKAFYFFPKI